MMQLAGRYPPPAGTVEDIPGLELAGLVEGIGEQVTRYAVGDRVMAIVAGGAQAELAVVHERVAMAVPEQLDPVAAGGFPEAFVTAHDALFGRCGLAMGERVLINGAAGGVGIAAVQLAVAAGAEVVASVRAEALRERVAAFGARAVAPADAALHGPYDVVLELVGAPNLEADLAGLETGGRIAVIGIGAGARSEIDLRVLMGKRARIHGSTLRARPLEAKAAATRLVESHVLPLVRSARISVPVEATYALEDAVAAYERFAAGGKLGKIILANR
jgi:NADPH:quinone reductase-like Zn-dependent oxidoreductase